MLHYIRQEMLGRDKHTSSLSPFVSNVENKVLQIQPLGPYSQHSAQKARVLPYIRQEMLDRDKHTLLLNPLVSNVENKVL